MAEVVSFINMKGGVGKTTLTVNVAIDLAERHDRRVLVVDMDPQFNASTYLMKQKDYLTHINDDKKHTVLDIFAPTFGMRQSTVDGRKKTTKKKKISIASCTASIIDGEGRLDLVPSLLRLMELETSPRRTEDRLHIFLETVKDAYDYILIDCPPTVSFFTQAAMLASDRYLVPIKPDPLSTIGLPLLERWLEEQAELSGKELQAVGFVFCMVRSPLPVVMRDTMAELRDERGDEIFPYEFENSTIVAESVTKHKGVTQYAPNSKYATQVEQITDEFLDRIEGDNS